MATTLTLVHDYEAMGRPGKLPQRRHRADGPHPYQEPPLGPPQWRKATAAEMQVGAAVPTTACARSRLRRLDLRRRPAA